MAQPASEHSATKRHREAQQFVKHLLDELLECELDTVVASPQASDAPATATPDEGSENTNNNNI